MEPLKNPQQTQNLSNLQPKKDLEQKPLTKLIDSDVNPVKIVWEHPVGKAVIISMAGVSLLFAAGGFLRLFAWVRVGYNDFKNAGTTKLPPK